MLILVFFFTAPATTEIYTLSLHDALPILKAVLTLDLATDGFLEERHRLREAGSEDHDVGVEHLAVVELDRRAAAESSDGRLPGPDPSAPDERVGLRPDADALEVARQGRGRDQRPADAGLRAQGPPDARPHEPEQRSAGAVQPRVRAAEPVIAERSRREAREHEPLDVDHAAEVARPHPVGLAK